LFYLQQSAMVFAVQSTPERLPIYLMLLDANMEHCLGEVQDA